MKLPENINSRWVATLADEQLVTAEAQLHATFQAKERTEKARTGARYMLLQGSAPLVSAWHRWLLVNNEARSRKLPVHRRG